MNVRVIAVDRPGCGLSDFLSGRQFLDWPDDVVELADALQLDRFAVLGYSGGGPYAAACAFKIPERLTATAIVSGMGPVDAPGTKDGLSWTLSGKGSVTRRLTLMMLSLGLKKPDKFLPKIKESLKGPDKELVADKPEILKSVADSFSEALRPGIAGLHYEAGLYAQPWGFQLEDITAEVYLWHGEEDGNVLISVGRYVAGAIPNCHANFIENEGHLTLLSNYVRNVLGTLTA